MAMMSDPKAAEPRWKRSTRRAALSTGNFSLCCGSSRKKYLQSHVQSKERGSVVWLHGGRGGGREGDVSEGRACEAVSG